MDKIVLYTTHCPRCSVLEKKLNSKNISYTTVSETSEITKVCEKLGEVFVPILQVGDKYMNFSDAVNWINSEGVDVNAV